MNKPTVKKIGLLLCDDVDADAQMQFGNYSSMFQTALDTNQTSVHLVPIRCFEGEALPSSPRQFEGYVVSGSKHGVYDDIPWIHDLLRFIGNCWDAKTRVVGICFGHQALAHALGGRTEKSANGWGFGIQPSTILKRKPWMTSYETLHGDNYNLVVIHQDQIVEMPPQFETIAASDFCPHSMIVAGTTMLGVQGHPEFSTEYCKFRADYRMQKDIIDSETYASAIRSLEQCSLHSKTILKWIRQFLLLPD